MDVERLFDVVVGTCDHCGLPIHAGDISRNDYTYQVRLGGEHGTCGEDHHITTPEEHAQHEETARHLDAFAGMFKDFYCKEQ